jgi:putative toxin-antitoxin system antitoxin component (TIGR02293 family)
MKKPDKTKNKGSGPKGIKGKGSRSKDSISDSIYVGNDVLNTTVSPEKKRIEVVFESNKPAYEIQTRTIPEIKNREDYLLESKFDDLKISLNTEITLSEFFNNKLLIINAIEKGIPFSIFESIRDVTPLTTNEWADYLGLSSRSLNRYLIQNKTFSPIYSEKIIELIEVFKLGLEVFGDQNSFNHWLNTPNFALGNIKPYELLKNSYGKEMVLSELTGISHGILV